MGVKIQRNIRSVFPALMFELSAFLLEFIHKIREVNIVQFVFSGSRGRGSLFALDPMNKIFSGRDLDRFERTIGPFLPFYRQLGLPPESGRLGQVVEGGGTIGNYKNQMKPIHDWLMLVLSKLPGDGTFEQTRI